MLYDVLPYMTSCRTVLAAHVKVIAPRVKVKDALPMPSTSILSYVHPSVDPKCNRDIASQRHLM
jgi:hypothetical protein